MNLNLKNHQDKKVNKEIEKNKIGSFMFLSLVFNSEIRACYPV